jgi:hypothetical protein
MTVVDGLVKFSLVMFIVALVMFSSADPAQATDLRKLSTSDMTRIGARIVVAKCTDVSVKQEPTGIFTYYGFNVIKLVKGKLEGNSFKLRLIGGRIGSTILEVPEMPTFAHGEEVVLFLGKDNDLGYPTISIQGVFKVSESAAGKKILPEPSGLKLIHIANNKPYAESEEVVLLDDFLAAVSSALKPQR